jgi:hypothetical protein
LGHVPFDDSLVVAAPRCALRGVVVGCLLSMLLWMAILSAVAWLFAAWRPLP